MTQGALETYYHGIQEIDYLEESNRDILTDLNRNIKQYYAFSNNADNAQVSKYPVTNSNNNWNSIHFLYKLNIQSINGELYASGILGEYGGLPDIYIEIEDSNGEIIISSLYDDFEFPKEIQLAIPVNFPATLRVYDEDNLTSNDLIAEISLTNPILEFEYNDNNSTIIDFSFREQNNPALDMFWALQKSYDYFNEFGWAGPNGTNKEINSLLYLGGKVNQINNAYAITNPTFGTKPIISAGYGDKLFSDSRTTLDFIGHEYTHTITDYKGVFFNATGETGALKEAFADIFATAIERYVFGDSNFDWKIGNFHLPDSDGPNPPPLRLLSNPTDISQTYTFELNENEFYCFDYRQPDTYEFNDGSCNLFGSDLCENLGTTTSCWVDTNSNIDKGGVHTNSSVISYWFYLIANKEYEITPLNNINQNGISYSVKSIGFEKAEKLVYEIISSNDLNNNSQFEDVVNASINISNSFYFNNLHSFTIQDIESIKNAWFAVGLYENPNGFCSTNNIISEASGVIEDGSSLLNYNNNQNCSWIVQPTGANSVTVDFTLFELGNGDSLTVYDGVDNTASVLGIYSGNSLPPLLTSSTGAIFIEFLTDNSNTGEGWSLNYSSITSTEYCNTLTEIIDANADFGDGSGSENYGNNSNCSWRIVPENATYINIEFSNFDLEDGQDFVSIYDGLNSEDGTLLGTFTGSNLPNSLTASSGQAFVKFVSNNINTQQGWAINYTSDGIQPCSGTTTLNATNGTVSDGSGTDNYGNNANCSWLIQPTNATSITLIFDELNLQEPSLDGFSVFDYLEIYDGNDDSGEPMVTYTGNQFLPIIVQSSGESLFIKFVTNSLITDTGWQFTYTSSTTDYCAGTTVLEAASGTINDNSGSNNYNSNSDCRWLIQPDNATSIELTFTAFDTEIGQDGVVVYDGPDTSFPYTAYSGSNLPNTIYSSSGAMLVRFLSDAQNEFQGFEANYIANIAPEGNPNSIVSYQYWFNDDYANVTSSSNFGAVNTLNLSIQSNTSSISNGLNTLHIRTKDVLGFWSSVLSEYVYVQNANSSGSNNNVVNYEYWFDSDYSNKVTGNGSGTNPLILNLNTNVNTLEKGLHQFHIRFKDEKGAWSSIVSEFIYNNKPEGLGNNMISAYRYWFNDDFDNRVSETVSLEVNYMFLEDIDISGLTNNSTNYIHFQFKDIYNNWSSVLTEEFLFETLSINEPNAERLKLYPNPTNSIIYVATKIENGRLTIYDNLGKLIQEFDTIPSDIDISNFENGLYLFQIKSKNKVYQEKVIKF